jgi:hypothetical protein
LTIRPFTGLFYIYIAWCSAFNRYSLVSNQYFTSVYMFVFRTSKKLPFSRRLWDLFPSVWCSRMFSEMEYEQSVILNCFLSIYLSENAMLFIVYFNLEISIIFQIKKQFHKNRRPYILANKSLPLILANPKPPLHGAGPCRRGSRSRKRPRCSARRAPNVRQTTYYEQWGT